MKALCAAIILAISTWSVAAAKPVDVANEKFSVDIPDSWSVTQSPVDTYQVSSVLIFSATNAEKTSALEIMVCTNPRGIMADHVGFISTLKDNISNQALSHGGQVQFTSEGKLSLNDVPAYLIQYTVTVSSHQMLARAYAIAANGKLYLVMERTVDANADADLAAIANSLHFATPPELPKPPVSHRMLKIALAVGAAVAVLIAIVVAIVIFRRRRQEEEEDEEEQEEGEQEEEQEE